MLHSNLHLPAMAWAILMAGCASTQLHAGGSTAAIRSAEEAGARLVPAASLHLQLAEEELAAANKLHEEGDHEAAVSMLLRAEADAELAGALSRAAGEKAEAQAALDRVRTLQTSNPYATGGAK